MAEMMRRGLSKMAPAFEKRQKEDAKDLKKEQPGLGTEHGGEEEKTHTITEHGDGSFTSKMHDGAEEKHPDHMHMLAHMGHHLTGGDKHHIAHHDGMSVTTHGIHESGEHDGPHEHNSAEEAKEAMGNFLDEEAKEPAHQHGGEEEMEPSYGGM